MRWIAAGGGSAPELNQVSLEQDLALAREVLGEGGRLFFAGGPGSDGVQVLDAAPRGDPLMLTLGRLFSPRGGRDSHYRKTTLPAHGPATANATLDALEAALKAGTEPLLVYLGGHGEQGERPRDALVRLWGQWPLGVVDLAAVLDKGPAHRPVRVVSTACFSGGFAELVFREADEARGAATSLHCGLFAAPWDAEASGCDPDPDRRAQEGYGLHFLNALGGKDRDGRALPKGDLDLDGDGRISLLEAHTRVRIASAAADVPTTTSERWLRFAAPKDGAEAELPLPEEDAVIRALGAGLGLAGHEEDARAQAAAAREAIASALDDLEEAHEHEDDAFYDVSARLLARWPVLDDPWHPDFGPMMARDRAAIEAALRDWPELTTWEDATRNVDRLDAFVQHLRVRAAPVERLVRALDTRQLARRLKSQGGDAWTHFARLLACERTIP